MSKEPITAEEAPNGAPFTASRYGTQLECVAAERDYWKQRAEQAEAQAKLNAETIRQMQAQRNGEYE